MEKYRGIDIANYFLKHSYDLSSCLTQKKLHKLMFLAYAWYLYAFNKPNNLSKRLFSNTFQGWVHGPVLREIYPRFSGFGYQPITVRDNISFQELTSDDKSFLDKVYETYEDFSADELEALTHSCNSWKESRQSLTPYEVGKNPLKDELIYQDVEEIL